MELLDKAFDERIEVIKNFKKICSNEILSLANAIVSIFREGNKLLLCGNGGSASDSQHLAAELMSSFSSGLNRRSLPAISLNVDTSIITAISNDFHYNMVFSRQVEGLGVKGDGILIFSTSGMSENCLSAAVTAKEKGLKVLSMTRSNSPLYFKSDSSVGVPSINTQYIQECHEIAYHILADLIDK